MKATTAPILRVPRITLVLPYVTMFLTAISCAWYAWSNHKVLKRYELVKNAFHATDEEMTNFAARLPEIWEGEKRQEEFAAAIALRVLYQLDSGDVAGARHNLATTLSIYYRGHRTDGNTNVIAHIERYASTN